MDLSDDEAVYFQQSLVN